MKICKDRIFFLLLLTVFPLSSFAQYMAAAPGEFIVRFKSMEAARSFYAKPGVKAMAKHEWLSSTIAPIGHMKTLTKDQFQTTLTFLQSSPEVAYIEPNYLYSVPALANQYDNYFNQNRSAPTDKHWKELWGLSNSKNPGVDINALRAWEVTRGNQNVVVAVIDTGVDYTHPDLQGNMWVNKGEIAGNNKDDDNNGFVDDIYGYDFANTDSDPMDDNSHGTHCAGTIGAVHDTNGVAGVMGSVKIMALKFLTGQGSGSTAGAIKAIEYATKMGAHVMSNSWGGGGASQALKEAIVAAAAKGIVFVAAAGNSSNDNDRSPNYPSNYDVPNVIAVAAMDINGKPASFTSYGQNTVHVSAPGVNILSTVPNGQYKSYSGTSMATPHVSGVVGLVLSTNGLQSVGTMRERLIKTSKKSSELSKISASGGYVDAFAAVTGQVSQD
ncbi:MAG: S8 family serine peptidase [Bacteriovoracaceae bacterium]|nr:S8 family serine peptidase [Bacteriovoracaceae bacterium]